MTEHAEERSLAAQLAEAKEELQREARNDRGRLHYILAASRAVCAIEWPTKGNGKWWVVFVSARDGSFYPVQECHGNKQEAQVIAEQLEHIRTGGSR